MQPEVEAAYHAAVEMVAAFAAGKATENDVEAALRHLRLVARRSQRHN